MADLHEAVFRWPYAGEDVILTGTFDQWSRSMHLIKGSSGFEGTVRVPWSAKVAYKFIVDGCWATTDQAPTELDGAGNRNNVYHAPAKPTSFTIVNELPMVAVVPEERHPDSLPEPHAAVEGKFQEAPEALPSVHSGTSVSSPVERPVEEVEPTLPSVANGHSVVPLAPVLQSGFTSLPAETPVKELPADPVEAKPIVVVDAVVSLPTEPQVVAPKIPLPIVPVNDSTLVSEPSVTIPDAPQSGSTPSTHTPFVNSQRKSLNSSPPIVPDKGETKANGTTKTNGTIGTSTSSSPPTTPKKQTFPSSRSESPISREDESLRSSKFGSKRSKRNSFFRRLKIMLTPEKDKEKHKVKK